MYCRICGHDNGPKDTGPCDNCGFKLEEQNLPLSEQRAGLQKPLPVEGRGPDPRERLWVPRRSAAGYTAVLCITLGAAISVFILTRFERAEYEPPVEIHTTEFQVEERPLDSLPIRLQTDIVYEFNREGTSAIPRTNVDLALIPIGTRVSFLGHRDLSIRPVVSYITQKMAGRDFGILEAHHLYCWTDTSMTSFQSVPLVKPFVRAPGDTTSVEPLLLRFLFTAEWLRGEVQELNIDVVEPSGGFGFNPGPFENVLRQVTSRLARRDYGERPVHVVLLFPDHVNLGQMMDITREVLPYADSLGYQGFQFRYATIE